MPSVTNNSTNTQDFTSTSQYPGFASKEAFIIALSDWHNEGQRDLQGLIAQLCNTDTGSGGDWADGTVTYAGITQSSLGKMV